MATTKKDKKLPAYVEEGKLPVDIYHTDDEYIIRTVIAGVKQEDLDISIVNDLVTIKGERLEPESVEDKNYIKQECYWGAFSRTCVLPDNIDTDNSKAILSSKGILTIRFPIIKE
ncbi:MAG TPA: Hsp20/alpha crystallin family protein [Candidatus Paceibacterota bacterium]|jgi:HSP20 family protein|nr:Hsp20/alpha crystallin family protein [Candidatus Paceibacterota bacterium]